MKRLNVFITLTLASCTSAAPIGGPVVGGSDAHCWTPGAVDGGLTLQVQNVNISSCSVTDGGIAFDEDAGSGSPYGPTMFNTAGTDDDCKYVVSWSSTPISKGQDVTFFVSAQYATNGAPLAGLSSGDGGAAPVASCPPLGQASPQIYFEVAGDPDGGLANHVNPATAAGDFPLFETRPGSGVYQIGPAPFFDESGLWYVRFHFNENCCDVVPDSPHGHAAFYVTVP